MTFLNNIPQAADFLDQSQPQLLANNQALDSIFGIDHYAFSNLTSDSGFHNKVTTPGYVTIPPTVPVIPPGTTTNPVFYGFNPLDAGGIATTNLGLLQYSRGPSNAVPTPVTHLQSTASAIVLANNATVNVFDFTGVPRAFAMLYAMDTTNGTTLGQTRMVASVFWSGTVLVVDNGVTQAAFLRPNVSGNILRLLNNNSGVTFNNIYWTLDLLRVS